MDIEHVALNVSDPKAMAAWYVEHLRMKILRHLVEAPWTHFIADRSGRTVLEIYHQTKAVVPDYGSFDPMVVHIAFKVADVAGTRQRLLAAGATSAGDVVITPNGDEMAFLRDPWGVTVQLVKRAVPL
jgi:glyoxylase I family protein